MDADRRRLGVGLVVGALLLTSGVIPHPVFGSPYETREPAPYLHQAVPEGSDQFDRLVDLYEFDPESLTPVTELSPAARTAVERTVDREPEADGWRRYELPVCRESVLVCDSVREPPADFEYGEGPPAAVFRLVSVDGERYLLQTGVQTGAGLSDGLGDQPASTYLWLGGLLPFGVVVIASQAIAQRTGERRLPALLTAAGGGLVVAGVAVPYLVVAGVASYEAIVGPVTIGVIGATALAVAALITQTVRYTTVEN
ncbi:hypothetical protein [Halohasta salina]|uniref:hypothetical protein n=1 Tax=Halohasta salina TaxID=2961621 RepID=UPI0020A29637|nr:hypothetical protein [Halohasta salina]